MRIACAAMPIPTEPIGSIPRPAELIAAWADRAAGRLTDQQFKQIAEAALRETIRRFEETGSQVITDGEQTKSSFATYPLDGASDLAPDGVVVPFKDGHTRQLPRLTRGPFRYTTHASKYRTLLAARYIPVQSLGTTDDCGFAPFATIPRHRERSRSGGSARVLRARGVLLKSWTPPRDPDRLCRTRPSARSRLSFCLAL